MSAGTGTTGYAVYLGDLRIARDTTSVLADSYPSVSIQSSYSGSSVTIPLDDMIVLIEAAKSGALDHLVTP